MRTFLNCVISKTGGTGTLKWRLRHKSGPYIVTKSTERNLLQKPLKTTIGRWILVLKPTKEDGDGDGDGDKGKNLSRVLDRLCGTPGRSDFRKPLGTKIPGKRYRTTCSLSYDYQNKNIEVSAVGLIYKSPEVYPYMLHTKESSCFRDYHVQVCHDESTPKRTS